MMVHINDCSDDFIVTCGYGRIGAGVIGQVDGESGQRPEDRGDSAYLQFWITGDSFMRSMVRILVGTMVEVADGTRSIESFHRLLLGAERPDAGMTAPAQGLYLVSVRY